MTSETLARSIVARLRAAGHQAYLVGGCVRDLLLGRAPKDFDVATDARPDRVSELFERSEQVGAHFGVVLVRENTSQVEVATFRSDASYSDGRRPDAGPSLCAPSRWARISASCWCGRTPPKWRWPPFAATPATAMAGARMRCASKAIPGRMRCGAILRSTRCCWIPIRTRCWTSREAGRTCAAAWCAPSATRTSVSRKTTCA